MVVCMCMYVYVCVCMCVWVCLENGNTKAAPLGGQGPPTGSHHSQSSTMATAAQRLSRIQSTFYQLSRRQFPPSYSPPGLLWFLSHDHPVHAGASGYYLNPATLVAQAGLAADGYMRTCICPPITIHGTAVPDGRCLAVHYFADSHEATREGLTWQDKTGQGKTRPDKTRLTRTEQSPASSPISDHHPPSPRYRAVCLRRRACLASHGTILITLDILHMRPSIVTTTTNRYTRHAIYTSVVLPFHRHASPLNRLLYLGHQRLHIFAVPAHERDCIAVLPPSRVAADLH
jgi:hypothetical protein